MSEELDEFNDMGPAFTRSGHAQVPLLLIGRMDAKIDLLLLQNNRHAERIGALEAWKNRAMGLALAAGAAAGCLSGYLPKLFALAAKG